MELAINYSTQAVELLREGKIRLDRFKCADWPDMIADASNDAPIYVHFPLEAGLKVQRQPVDLESVAVMREQTHTPLVNTHLIAYEADGQDDSTIEETMTRDITALVERFGAVNVIAENIPYYEHNVKRRYARVCTDVNLIRRVLEHTGCGLLLDLSHARIAATNLGLDPHAYIESLPVDRLSELHVTGIDMVEGRLLDHMPFSDQDWTWLEWAMQRIRRGDWRMPWAVAFEYGGIGKPFAWRSEKSVIAGQMPRLFDLVHGSK